MVFWRGLQPQIIKGYSLYSKRGEGREEDKKALTVGNKSDVFTPSYGDIEMLACALEPYFNFLHGSIST